MLVLIQACVAHLQRGKTNIGNEVKQSSGWEFAREKKVPKREKTHSKLP